MIKNENTSISSILDKDTIIGKIMKGLLKVYENFKSLPLSKIPPLTLPKCKGVPLLDYKIYGESVQESKNLFNINDINASSANHIINNNAISVLSAGTGTYRQVTYKKIPAKAFTKYYLSFQYEVVGSGKARISVYQYDENNTFITDKPFYSPGVLETRDNTKYIEVRIYANEATVIPTGEGVIYSNIQIEKGNVATDYEPYKTPTPETPIEVESVGEKTNNLVNIPTTALTTSNKTIAVDLPVGKVYTLSAKIESNGVTGRIRFIYNLNGTDIYSQNAWKANDISIASGFEIPEGATDIRVLLQRGTNFDGVFSEIMVLEGTYTVENLPAYEPYGYKIPVKARGKNSLNLPITTLTHRDVTCTTSANNTMAFSGISTQYPIFNFNAVNIPANTNIRLSYDETNDERVTFRLVNSVTDERLIITNVRTFTTTFNIDVFQIALNPNHDYSNTVISNIQIEIGTEATKYEPYVEPITTNIYLNEPLRKIGDYADYIDFESQKVVRKIGKHIYNENDNWQVQNASYWFESGVTTAFYTQVPKNALQNTQGLECLCNLFNYDSTANGINKKAPYISGNIGSLVVAFYNTTASTLEELKTFLAQTNLEIIYKLATPTEETIDLPNIPTHKGTTIIEVDTSILPSNMEVVYKGKEV